MSVSNHEFGGISTDLKLALVEDYLKAFTTALRNQSFELWYIDAFAGTGERTVRIASQTESLLEAGTEERIERRRGSARIAIEIEPKFDHLIFMDKNPKHCVALRQLQLQYSSQKIEIVEGEANQALLQILNSRSWKSTRAVMFLDPYGMSVNWDTLSAIAATGAIDVWYLVSLSGIFRQAARNNRAIDNPKRAKLNRMLGSEDWEQSWYSRIEKTDLFGNVDEENKRIADVGKMESYVGDRLKTIFPAVLSPFRLTDDRGIPQFALFFAISNPSPLAIGLASKIANHILKSGKASHTRSR